MSCHSRMVSVLSSSFFTRLPAMSTRNPSQPRSSQKAITSFMAWRVASASGESTALCQSAVILAKP